MTEPNPVQEPTPATDPAVQPTQDPSPDPVPEPVTWDRVESLLKTRLEEPLRLMRKMSKSATPAAPSGEPTAPDPAAITAEAERRSDLALDLMAAGMSKDMARKMSRADALLPTGWETSEEVIASLKADMPGAFTPQNDKPRAPGGGGGRNGEAGNVSQYGFDAAECQRAFDELGPTKYREWHAKNRTAILAAQGMEDGDGMKMSASMTSIGPQPKR